MDVLNRLLRIWIIVSITFVALDIWYGQLRSQTTWAAAVVLVAAVVLIIRTRQDRGDAPIRPWWKRALYEPQQP